MIIYFADSCHVGTVCLLSNRKPDTKARIDVDLEDYYRIKDAKNNDGFGELVKKYMGQNGQ